MIKENIKQRSRLIQLIIVFGIIAIIGIVSGSMFWEPETRGRSRYTSGDEAGELR
jgi:hypothetical protein